MGERDEFDRIVEQLDLDLTFPDEAPPPEDVHDTARAHDQTESARSPDIDEEFYRRVTPPPARSWRRGTTLAWIGIAGSPAALVLCTLAGVIAPRSVVVALSLVFVAAAIFLVSQLPEHGPSRGDDPDDGAVL